MTKRTINLLCGLLICFSGYATTEKVIQVRDSITVKYDNSAVDQRDFSTEKINAFKSDGDFDYGTRPAVKLNFLERIIRWILKWISKFTAFTAGKLWPKIIFYAVLAGIIVYAILKLMGIDINKALYRQIDKGTLPFDILEENIHELDFEKLIEEAIDRNEYKKAIRLYYLFALKKLSDKELIHWHPGKTNHTYQEELKIEAIKPSFDDLGYYFDYAWYGDFNINQNLFVKVKAVFNDFKNSVESHKS